MADGKDPIVLRVGKDAFKAESQKARLLNVEISGKDGRPHLENIWLAKSITAAWEPDGDTIVFTVPLWWVSANKMDGFLDEAWVAAGMP